MKNSGTVPKSPITYSPSIEEQYLTVYQRALDFLGRLAINRDMPAYLQIYKDCRLKKKHWIGSDKEHTWLAYSNREPSEELEARLMKFSGSLEGIPDADYNPETNSIIVDGITDAEWVLPLTYHETCHALVLDRSIEITHMVDGIPKNFYELAGFYRFMWNRLKEEGLKASPSWPSLSQDVKSILSGEIVPRINLAEFYCDLLVLKEDGPRIDRSGIEYRRMLQMITAKIHGFETLEKDPLAFPAGFLNVAKIIRGSANHLPAWAAARLYKEYGDVDQLAQSTGVLRMTNPELWSYLGGLSLE